MKRVIEEYFGPYSYIREYYVPDDYPVMSEHYRVGPDEWYIVTVQDAKDV